MKEPEGKKPTTPRYSSIDQQLGMLQAAAIIYNGRHPHTPAEVINIVETLLDEIKERGY